MRNPVLRGINEFAGGVGVSNEGDSGQEVRWREETLEVTLGETNESVLRFETNDKYWIIGGWNAWM